MRSALVLAGVRSPVLLLGARAGTAQESSAPADTAFPRPPELEHQINFWRDVFTAYSAGSDG